MSIKPAYENLTASTVWLAGILLLLCLLVLCLVAIFVARLRWNRRRLPIYYASKDACSSNYRQQYLVRLSYERDPRTCGHKDDCQVWAELLYDENKSIIIVPLYINRIYQYNKLPTSMVLVRTIKCLSDIRSVHVMDNCAKSCLVADTLEQDDSAISELSIVSLNIQNLAEPNLIATKVEKPAINPKNIDSKKRECAYMELGVFYTFAVERPERIDMHSVRYSIVCPWVSWMVCTFVAVCSIFVMVAFVEVHLVSGNNGSSLTTQLILVTSASLNALLFFISAQYLFVVWIQEALYEDSLGQRQGAAFLYNGVLLLAMLLGLIFALGGVFVVNSLDYASVDGYITTNWRGLKAILISILVYAILLALVCFVEQKIALLSNAIWPWLDDPMVCPQQSSHKNRPSKSRNKVTKGPCIGKL